MTKIIEFTDEYEYKGNLPELKKSSHDKYYEWYKSWAGKKPTIKSIQHIPTGLFVVYE